MGEWHRVRVAEDACGFAQSRWLGRGPCVGSPLRAAGFGAGRKGSVRAAGRLLSTTWAGPRWGQARPGPAVMRGRRVGHGRPGLVPTLHLSRTTPLSEPKGKLGRVPKAGQGASRSGREQSSSTHTLTCLTGGSPSGPRPAVSAAAHLGSWLCGRMAGRTLTWRTTTPIQTAGPPVMTTCEEQAAVALQAPACRQGPPGQSSTGRALNKPVLCACPVRLSRHMAGSPGFHRT